MQFSISGIQVRLQVHNDRSPWWNSLQVGSGEPR
jgi:hypothetical protein